MRTRVVACVVAAVLGAASLAWAQFGFGRGGDFRISARLARPDSFDGRFHYCRAAYRMNPRGDGGGWLTDYPNADIDLMIRVAELTKTPVGFDRAGQPEHLIVRLTDDTLFQCPFIMMQEVGTIFLSDEDASRLRAYLLKGGFLWVDDFWGTQAWRQWTNEIAKVLPPSEYPIEDVPSADPMLKGMFEVAEVPQITNIQFWRGVGGQTTSERGPDSAQAHLRAIRDHHGRIMVLMTHNTDVADSWEREGEDPGFFYQFSPHGYALGIDVLLHAMTH